MHRWDFVVGEREIDGVLASTKGYNARVGQPRSGRQWSQALEVITRAVNDILDGVQELASATLSDESKSAAECSNSAVIGNPCLIRALTLYLLSDRRRVVAADGRRRAVEWNIAL